MSRWWSSRRRTRQAGSSPRPVSLRDLAATIVDLAGLRPTRRSPAHRWPGWQPSPRPDAAPVRAPAALAEVVPNETLGPTPTGSLRPPWPLAALTEDGWSYIRREGEVREELLTSRDDPREQRDIAAAAGPAPGSSGCAGLLGLTRGPLTPERFNP